jgi:hypothetical protein
MATVDEGGACKMEQLAPLARLRAVGSGPPPSPSSTGQSAGRVSADRARLCDSHAFDPERAAEGAARPRRARTLR